METKGASQKGKKLKKRTIAIIVCFFVAFIIAAAFVAYNMFFKKGNSNSNGFQFGGMRNSGAQSALAEGMIAAGGVTNAGIIEESFDVENLTTPLEIEEVYIAAEDIIEKGSKVLKLSEESIAEARKELEKTRREAELAYRSGVIEYEQKKITAKYDKDSAILKGKQAKAVYDETTAGLNNSVEKAQKELDDAKKDIAEYQSYVNDNSYTAYYKVDEYQADYDNTLAALKARIEEWGVSWPQVTGQGGAGTMGNAQGEAQPGSGGDKASDSVPTGDAQGETPEQSNGPTSDKIQALSSLYKVLEKQLKALEQAKSDAETAALNDSFKLQTLELGLPGLEKAVTEAKREYENQLLQAKLTYEKSLAGAESAESDYETALQQAETKLESLRKAWEDAEVNLELFESRVGDGYFCASESGTVLKTMLGAKGELTSEAVVFEYSNPREITVLVSVDQTNISRIALHDSAYVQSEEYGLLEGVVTKVNPIASSDSRTNVTYSVTVKLTGESAGIPANKSVVAIFGANAETIQNMINAQSGQSSGSVSGNSGSQGGSKIPADGQMPQGGMPQGEMPWGEMPQGGRPQGEMPQGGRPGRAETGSTDGGTKE